MTFKNLCRAAGCVALTISCDHSQEPPTDEAPSGPQATVEYANPDLLVSTDWLEEHLDDDAVRIVDARSADDYATGHVPGAVNITPSETFDSAPEPGNVVGPPEQVGKLFGDNGIDEYAHVIVYDQGRATAAARLFWTLEYYGHPNVSVLNGGMAKWEAEGRARSADVPEVTQKTFAARARPEVLSTKDAILKGLEDPDALALDARSDEEYTGERALAERGGHIPDAVHLEWTGNFTDSDVPVFKGALELASMYERAGVTKDKRVHAY